jgi:lipoprotein-releasing system ATP-binding protein
VLLELEHIEKHYDSPSGADPVPVLKDISLRVNSGESIAIVGPSGSGKSTLLNIIGALDKPSSGTVILSGQKLSELSDKELAEIRNRDIGFVFQLHHLLPQCTVLENVLIPTIPRGLKSNSKKIANRASELLDRVGLKAHMHHRPGQLSGGEQQRVAVVRALINEPQLVLADEPTGSLDQVSAHNLGQLLVELNKEEKVTLILVTHSLELAQKMSRVYELYDGKLTEKEKSSTQ